MVAESWFRSLWKTPKKNEPAHEKAFIGVLTFEVASLMSKLIHLWHSLTEKQIGRLREEIANSAGIKKLVSDDDEYIGKLIWGEMIDNMVLVASSVARLGKKCSDPGLKSFEQAFEEWVKFGIDPNGWLFTGKKMERKSKKMEKFILLNANLYQEMEVLTDLEQTLRRMKDSDQNDGLSLLEFQRKVTWKQHEVKSLKDLALWNRTYDYTVLLLARSLFTIFNRIKLVFGIPKTIGVGESDHSGAVNTDQIYRSQSVSTLLQSSVRQPERSVPRFSSGPLGKFTGKSSTAPKASKTNNFFSGPLNVGASHTKSDPVSGKTRNVFYSGPIGMSATKSGPFSGLSKYGKKMWSSHDHHSHGNQKKSQTKSNRLTQVGPFKGCIIPGNGSPVTNCLLSSTDVHSRIFNNALDANMDVLKLGNFMQLNPSGSISKCKLSAAQPETLGFAALALHYANVVIIIEKLAASPHLIGIDARDDLYSMLPVSIRISLREKLKPFSKSLTAGSYDTSLAREWSTAIAGILEWLGPLAHNTIRWQSERSFEQQNLVSKAHVLLVQTLYYANQDKTEATITELLLGLNYIWRFGRELNGKAIVECASSRNYDGYLEIDG